MQVRDPARSSFSILVVISTFDVVGRHQPDRLTGETPFPGHHV
jgi:hypothetical protein